MCLMSLDKTEAVPVDTHVWQIAQRDYGFGKGVRTKTLNKATYDAVGEHFRKLWGKEAGWAHSVLFAADLKVFEERLVVKKEKVVRAKKEVKVEDGVEIKKETEEVETKVKVETSTRKRIKDEAPVNGIDSVDTPDIKDEGDDDASLMTLAERVKRRRRK